MKTPIVFIIFNRPEETQLVFNAIKKAQPEKLLVIADGPKNKKDQILCKKVRVIIETTDWKCEIIKNYSEINLGCKERISSGLNWVFNLVDRAIILEDDCLPNISFFSFCEKLLEKYKDNEKIMHIGGNFFQHRNKRFHSNDSYYFSKIAHIWGWATWKRAWDKYDVNISKWPKIKRTKKLKEDFQNDGAYEYWSKVWDQYYSNEIDSWDGQWFFNCINNKGLCINPCTNLVSNIGFSSSATHTKIPNDCADVPNQKIVFPLIHPKTLNTKKSYDDFIFRQNFGIDKKMYYRLLRPIKTKFPKFYLYIRKIIKKIILKINMPKKY